MERFFLKNHVLPEERKRVTLELQRRIVASEASRDSILHHAQWYDSVRKAKQGIRLKPHTDLSDSFSEDEQQQRSA
jgi:hypothetical protein